jgi:hypothetical protein
MLIMGTRTVRPFLARGLSSGGSSFPL